MFNHPNNLHFHLLALDNGNTKLTLVGCWCTLLTLLQIGMTLQSGQSVLSIFGFVWTGAICLAVEVSGEGGEFVTCPIGARSAQIQNVRMAVLEIEA